MIVVQLFPALQIIFKGTSLSNNLVINKRALADTIALQFVKHVLRLCCLVTPLLS